jgi:hypothetical protein
MSVSQLETTKWQVSIVVVVVVVTSLLCDHSIG